MLQSDQGLYHVIYSRDSPALKTRLRVGGPCRINKGEEGRQSATEQRRITPPQSPPDTIDLAGARQYQFPHPSTLRSVSNPDFTPLVPALAPAWHPSRGLIDVPEAWKLRPVPGTRAPHSTLPSLYQTKETRYRRFGSETQALVRIPENNDIPARGPVPHFLQQPFGTNTHRSHGRYGLQQAEQSSPAFNRLGEGPFRGVYRLDSLFCEVRTI